MGTLATDRILWWGRSDTAYSRNRILRGLLREIGFTIEDFKPRVSALGAWEANLRGVDRPALVWVPCFRQRDIRAAAAWARRRQVPVLFDPLISAYDKQVFEKHKWRPHSQQANRLLAQEQRQFQSADHVLADTDLHAEFFVETLGVQPDRISVVPVGAEETLFTPVVEPRPDGENSALEILFYGSFIGLQGTPTIVKAALTCRATCVRWTLIGNGPERAACELLAAGDPRIRFLDWVPYETLPKHLHRADVVLGVFGTTDKAGRVIPNKAYQALACARPLLTRTADTYPDDVRTGANSGIIFVPPGDPAALARKIEDLADRRSQLPAYGKAAYETYQKHFSMLAQRGRLSAALASLGLVTSKPD